jgi:hypothetical protein
MHSILVEDYILIPGLREDTLIQDVLPAQGKTQLNGAPKVGKSFLALQMALSVADDRPFFNYPVTKPGPVLYFQFDNAPVTWNKYLRDVSSAGFSIKTKHGLHTFPHPTAHYRRYDIMIPSDLAILVDEVRLVNPVLIVLDVLSKVHFLNENTAQDMVQVFARLDTLSQGRSLLILHHTAKPLLQPGAGQHSPSMSGRGSSFQGGDTAQNILLKRLQGSTASLEWEGRLGPSPSPLHLTRHECGLWLATSTPGGKQPSTGRIAAITLIQANREQGRAACWALAEAQGISHGTFQRVWDESKGCTNNPI